MQTSQWDSEPSNFTALPRAAGPEGASSPEVASGGLTFGPSTSLTKEGAVDAIRHLWKPARGDERTQAS